MFTPEALETLAMVESGGNPAARNARSTATGLFQFTAPTWLEFAAANPRRFAGMSREQILAARSDPALNREAAQWYARRNAATLRRQGHAVNDATLAMAHTFGPGGANVLLSADPNALVDELFGPRVVAANPHLRGRRAGDIRDMFNARYGQPLELPAAPRPQENNDMDLSWLFTPDLVRQYLAGGARPQVRAVDPAGGDDEAGLAARYGYALMPATTEPSRPVSQDFARALFGMAQRQMAGPPQMPRPQFQAFPDRSPGFGGQPVIPPTAGLLSALQRLTRPGVF